MRDIAEFFQWADGAGHGMDRLEGDDLGRARPRLGQQLLQVGRVVVAEDVLRHAAVTDALQNKFITLNFLVNLSSS